MTHFEPPIHWADHEDIAQKLYERFGDDFNEGKREESNEGHLEMIQSAWVYEWRDNQK